MSIDNPEIVRLTNEVVRPLAEQTRDLIIKLSIIQERIDRLMPLIPNDTSVILDGREAEGVSRLTGQDIYGILAIRNQIVSLITPEASALIHKACVRPLPGM
jgi:hypothetical protein